MQHTIAKVVEDHKVSLFVISGFLGRDKRQHGDHFRWGVLGKAGLGGVWDVYGH